jgi:hypothetical protein
MRFCVTQPIDCLLVRIASLPGSQIGEPPDAHVEHPVHSPYRENFQEKPTRGDQSEQKLQVRRDAIVAEIS